MTFLPAPVFPAHFWTIHALTEAPSAEPVLLDGAVGGIALRLVLRPGCRRILTHLCGIFVFRSQSRSRKSASTCFMASRVSSVAGSKYRTAGRSAYLLGLGERGRRTGTLPGGGLTVSYRGLALRSASATSSSASSCRRRASA